MSLAENIRKIRKDRGLTQKQLGLLCVPQIGESTIRKYELGLLHPKIETIQRIAKALEVNVSELRGFSGYKQSIIENSPFLSAAERLGFDNYVLAQDLLQQRLIENLDITEDKLELLYTYNKLNENGKKEAQKRILELTEIPRYVEESVDYATQTVAKSVKSGHIQFTSKEDPDSTTEPKD